MTRAEAVLDTLHKEFFPKAVEHIGCRDGSMYIYVEGIADCFTVQANGDVTPPEGIDGPIMREDLG
jgi:hypothetical protein